jgi:hypothetical protein
VAVFALTSCTVQVGTAWTGTAPGGTAAPSGTISSAIDLSSFVSQVELSFAADELDYTNFASGGWRQKLSGLASGTVQMTLNADFAATTVDDRFGLGGTVGFPMTSATPYYMDIRPTSQARSATNPSYVLGWLNLGVPVITGTVGDLAVVQYQFTMTGRPARLTS